MKNLCKFWQPVSGFGCSVILMSLFFSLAIYPEHNRFSDEQNNQIEKTIAPKKIEQNTNGLAHEIATSSNEQQVHKTEQNRKSKSLSDDSVIIRVLLERKEGDNKHSWNLKSEEDFTIINIIDGIKNKIKNIGNNIHIKFERGKFKINKDRQLYDSLFIMPNKSGITIGKRTYLGGLYFTFINNELFIVNYVDLEDYICSVAMSESCPHWPCEVNKTFFIMFRSYALTRIFEQRNSKKKNLPYDIENSTVHQVYKGIKPSDEFKKIGEETKGLILMYQNKPLEAMFDVCCGGVIPSKKKGLNFYKAPYLARSYPCHYCKNYKFYRWSFNFTFNNIEKMLQLEYPNIKKVKDIRVTSIDDAGIVQNVRIKTNSGWLDVTGSKLRSLLKLKSSCFNIKIKKNNIIISGKGFGHLTGLCQYGAYQMVQDGWNYKDILKFYYPKCTFMKLQKIRPKNSATGKLAMADKPQICADANDNNDQFMHKSSVVNNA